MVNSKKDDMGYEMDPCNYFNVRHTTAYLSSYASLMVFLYWSSSFCYLYFGANFVFSKGYL